jgi:hypothetical protein
MVWTMEFLVAIIAYCNSQLIWIASTGIISSITIYHRILLLPSLGSPFGFKLIKREFFMRLKFNMFHFVNFRSPRALLGASSMLAFITLSSLQTKKLPKVSYIKASEIWFFGCALFIFGSLVEFAFVNLIWRRTKHVALKKVLKLKNKNLLKIELSSF